MRVGASIGCSCLKLPHNGVLVTATTADGATTATSAETLLVASQRIAALGNSVTAAWGAQTDPTTGQNQFAESWSTGSDAAVNSHLARLAALFGIADLTAVGVQNNAASQGALRRRLQAFAVANHMTSCKFQ